MKRQVIHWPYMMLAIGVSVCLVGALLMIVGESLLGAGHAGIAAMVGITGIGIIGLGASALAGALARRRMT